MHPASDLQHRRRVEIPVYSFEKHAREEKTTSVYSPHVLVLEGIFALYDPRVLELLDLKIFAEADSDLCLARRSKCDQVSRQNPFAYSLSVARDVRDRGRDIEGCIKQWFGFVKPNFSRFVLPQREIADVIIPRGIENRVAIDMVVKHVQRRLEEKSEKHQEDLRRLGKQAKDEPLAANVFVLQPTTQIRAMDTILQNPSTDPDDFQFYFDRLAALLVERGMDNLDFQPKKASTPTGHEYHGLEPAGDVSAVVILRAGSCFETGLKRVIPDCQVGRMLIQTDFRTGEPELHFNKLPKSIEHHHNVLVLDPQMATGGAALMAVKVLVDHGVKETRIVFVTYLAGKMGVNRLAAVFPEMRIIVCRIVKEYEERWVEKRYFRC